MALLIITRNEQMKIYFTTVLTNKIRKWKKETGEIAAKIEMKKQTFLSFLQKKDEK